MKYSIYENNVLSVLRAVTVLLFLFAFVVCSFAQTKPGGTTLDVELWLKSDELSLTNGANVDAWLDVSGHNRHHYRNGTNQVPTFLLQGMNYHPALRFGTTVNTKLIGPQNFVQATRSYYVFYVSESESTGTQTVFALRASNNGRVGWTGSPSVPWMNTNGSRIASSGASKKYGIHAGIMPNQNATGTTSYLYVNGISNAFTATNQTLGVGIQQMLIGNSNTGTGESFSGKLSEIIVLSSTAGTLINPIELQKVQSYLAIKYGIALEAAGQSNYIDSDGGQFWTGANNLGYQNHIFGIGRDDAGGLYQKQSTNYEKNTATVFVGNFEKLNANNTGVLNNKDFLVFGSNNLNGFIVYEYEENHPFQNGTLSNTINKRHNTVLRAQKRGGISTVNISPNLNASHILVSPNNTFNPANTRIYTIQNFVAQNVVVNNGDYIGFAFFQSAPGGVNAGLRVWLNADVTNIDLVNGDEVDVWRDLTRFQNNYSYQATSGAATRVRPKYINCDPRMNFNPAVYFPTDLNVLAIAGNGTTESRPMSVNAPDNFTSFTIYRTTGYYSTARIYTHGFGSTNNTTSGTRYPAIGFEPGNNPAVGGAGRLYATGSGNEINGTVRGFRQNTTALHMVHLRKAAAPGGRQVIHDFGGWQDVLSTPGATNFGNNFLMASGATLGGASIGGSGNTSGQFQGLMSEVFYYERELTIEEQDRIRSYLGMKYAITLDANGNSASVNYDYKLSDGSFVWQGNRVPNVNYHNNVAGLVRDDVAGLNIIKARSTASGGIVTMLTPGTMLCGDDGDSFENNLSGIFWGHNGLSAASTQSYIGDPNICGEFDSRLNRIWLVDKTNLAKQTVNIRASGSDFLFNGANYQVYLLIADDPVKFANKNWDQVIPGTYVSGEHQFNYTFTNKHTYFTFAAKQAPGSCEGCEFKGAKKLEFTNAGWLRGSLSNTYDLGDDFTAIVKTGIESPSSFLSRYPRASSFRSLRYYRRGGNGNNAMRTEVELSKAALATFEIFEIDRVAARRDDIEVYGMCGGSIIMPKLSYVDRSDRSSYMIDRNHAIANNRTSSYTAIRGRLRVEFDFPVEKIFIVHKYTGAPASGYKRIGIGAIDFMCPQLLPPPTEDGLIFTKQGPTEVLLCEDVNYTFRITNTNCFPFPVNFSDILPSGMRWAKGSLSIDESAIHDNSINEYGDTNILGINNLMVLGSSTLTFRATARYDTEASAGIYSNRATIEYQSHVNVGVDVSMGSCDPFKQECGATVTNALASQMPANIVTSLIVDKLCYAQLEEIEITLQLQNPNAAALTKITLDIGYDDNFEYIENSLRSSNGLNLENATVIYDNGYINIEGFDLHFGDHQLTFRLRAPTIADFYIDPETMQPLPLFIEYTLDSETDDICLGFALNNANGGQELPLCNYCTQLPIGTAGAVVLKSNIGISTRKEWADNWPSDVANGFLVLESKSKGFVITRTTPTAIGKENWVIGMIIYDIELNCISMYNGVEWKCIERACNK